MSSSLEIILSDGRDDSPITGSHTREASLVSSPRAIPRRENLYEPVRDRYGWRLALVFGNHEHLGLLAGRRGDDGDHGR